MNKVLKNEVLKMLNETDNDTKFNEWLVKNERFMFVENIGYIRVCKAKPSIISEFYYDDETPKPNITEEYFINHNMFYYGQKLLKPSDNITSTVLIKSVTKGYYLIYRKDNENIKDDYIVVDDELLEKINTEIENARNDFKNRLQKYYKKYKSNIRAIGYWVNR